MTDPAGFYACTGLLSPLLGNKLKLLDRATVVRARALNFARGISRAFRGCVRSPKPLSIGEATSRSPVLFYVDSNRFRNFFRVFQDALGQEEACEITPREVIAATRNFTPSFSLLTNGLDVLHPLFNEWRAALEWIERFRIHLSATQPQVVVFAEGTSPTEAACALAARTLGIPTVRIQNGRAGVLHCGYRNMPFDVMLCWGEGFVERYRTTSPAPRYIVTGNPFIDHAATARPADAPPTVALFTQPVCATVSDADYGLLLELADRLLAAALDIRILVRRHPADRDARFVHRAAASHGRLQMADADTHTLDQVFSAAQCASGFFSTALSEAVARGVVPVMIRTGAQHAVFPHPEDEGAALLVHDLDSALARIDDVLRQRPPVQALYPAMQRFTARYFGPMDGQAIQRTVDAIRQSQKAYDHD